MKLLNSILPIIACLMQFHRVRSGSAATCQMLDMGGMTSNQVGKAFYDTPFTQDKSTLYSFLNTQIIKFMYDSVVVHPYLGFNFHWIANDPSQPQQGSASGPDGWWANNTIAYNGFFTPDVTGEYTFTIDAAKDAAGIYVYDNLDMLCCDDLDIPGWFPRTLDIINIPTDPEHTTGPKTTTLEAGKSYPFYIVYVNFSGDAELSISITDPSGQPISDLGPHFGFPIDSTCE